MQGLIVAGVTAVLLGGVGGVLLGTQAIAQTQTLTATTSVHIRSKASTSSTILGVLYQGQQIKSTGSSSNGWTPVTYNGKTAYVFSSYLKVAGTTVSSGTSTTPASTMRTTTTLNVRTGPSTSYTVVGQLPSGTAVSLTGTVSGNWAQITYNGQRRWVASGYLTASSANLTVKSTGVTTSATSVRASASSSAKQVAIVKSGATLQLTGTKSGSFTQIVWQGSAAWILSSCVKDYSASQPPKTPTSPSSTVTRYTTADLNIRASASTSSKIVAVANLGMALQLTGTVKNNMAQVKYNGGLYWASLSYLSATKPNTSSSSGSSTSNGVWTGGDSEGVTQLLATTKAIVNLVHKTWPSMVTFYGVRSDPLPDHPTGHAVDCMLPHYKTNTALGWAIANYLRAHAKQLDIQYIIFDQHIWNIKYDSKGWRAMADRGGDTANHKDHVHVTVKGLAIYN